MEWEDSGKIVGSENMKEEEEERGNERGE